MAKDRKERVLTTDNAMHYRRILAALDAIQGHMNAIDELIENAGGFLLSSSQEAQTVDVRAFFGKAEAEADNVSLRAACSACFTAV